MKIKTITRKPKTPWWKHEPVQPKKWGRLSQMNKRLRVRHGPRFAEDSLP